MRSGIGPAQDLNVLGVDVISDVPGVGKNLQEHPLVSSGREVNIPTFNTQARTLNLPGHALNYVLFGRGLLTSPAVVAMANVMTQPDLPQPDITFNFIPIAFDTTLGALSGATKRTPLYPRPAMRIVVNVCNPHSRGEIRLKSTDPAVSPIIDHRLLGDDRDVATLIRGVKLVDKVFGAKAFAPYVVKKLAPEIPEDEADWEPFVRRTAGIGYHPVGTCSMGVGRDAVVDPQLRVKGVSGLRVADASIMPRIVSANTHAPSVMIGERAADPIRH